MTDKHSVAYRDTMVAHNAFTNISLMFSIQSLYYSLLKLIWDTLSLQVFAVMESSDWWEGIQRWKDEWKCVEMRMETMFQDGAQCVASSGLQPTLMLYVATWDSVTVKV